MPKTTLIHLETALTVTHIGSFSGAARKLNATQPAISARIRDLESSLGYRLFIRRGQRMELTMKGREFIEKIEPLFLRLRNILNERDSPIPASVRVGCGPIAMSTWLGKVIGGMQEKNTRLRFQVSIGISALLIPLLEQDKLDIAVVPGKIDYPGLHTEHLGRRLTGTWVTTPDRWIKYSSYAKSNDKPALKDLINCGPLWTPPLSSRLHEQQISILRDYGAEMHNVNTCDDSRVLADMIQNSGGLGYVQKSMVKDKLLSRQLIEVQQIPAVSEPDYYFVWRDSNLLPIVNMLIKLTKAQEKIFE